MKYVEATDDLPLSQYDRLTSWLYEDALSGRYENSEFFVVSNKSSAIEHMAAFEVINKYKNIPNEHCLKIMSIFFSPAYDSRQPDTADSTFLSRQKMIASLATEILTFSMNEMFRRNAAQVKLYANSSVNKELLGTVAVLVDVGLQKRIQLDIDMHGGWLVITRNAA